MKSPSRLVTLSAFAAALAAGVVTLAVVAHAESAEAKHRAAPEVRLEKSAVNRDRGVPQSFAPVVKKTAPSVVYVFSSKTVKFQHPDMMPFFDDPTFRRFFDDQAPSGRRRGQNRPQSMRQQALGSGVIVSSDGYILTNNHVVEGADEVKVALNEGKNEYVAEVVGRDSKTDIAVLKIDAKSLAAATLGDSDQLEVGDVVLAIGNPFQVGLTVTQGIVSATRRGNLGIEEYEDFIQTDAAINPGNSGGALVDAEGRVVGINTAIYSQSGGSMGVGFAIPINLARSIMDQLVTKGKIVRGFIGVGFDELTPDTKKYFGVEEGAAVTNVVKDSPADKAGIKQGDVIVKLDGVTVTDGRRLRFMVGRLAPGTEVAIEVIRKGKPETFKLKLAEQRDQVLGSDGQSGAKDDDEGTLNGVGVTDLNEATRGELNNVPKDLQGGAVITEVDPESAAAKAGLREGDIILEINREPVKNAKDAIDLTSKPETKRTLLLILRDGARRYVVVDETQPAKKK